MLSRVSGKIIQVAPNAASFATPYSSGDVIGGVNTIPEAVLNTKGDAALVSLVVLDKANQKSAIDLIFFNEAPANSVGADNAAYALNDADLDKVIGRVTVAAADYVSSSTNNAEATLRGTSVQLILEAIAKSRDLYVVVVSRGTPTYGSASDLSVKLGLQQF